MNDLFKTSITKYKQPMQLGRNLRKLRELNDYSQEYMAGKLGVSQVTYSRIENNKTKLDVLRLIKIAEILNVNPFVLIDITSPINDLAQISNYLYSEQNKCYKNSVKEAETEKRVLVKYIQKLEKELSEIKTNSAFTQQKQLKLNKSNIK